MRFQRHGPEHAFYRLALLLLWAAGWFVNGAGASSPGDAAAPEWKTVRRVGEIEISRRPVSGSSIPAVRGRTHFPAPVADVFHVISDYDRFAGFIPHVSESRVVEQNGRATLVYQRLGFPVPVADRHYIIHVVNDLHALPMRVIDISWELDRVRSLALSTKDALVPVAFSGSWHLEAPAGQAGCDAIYTIHVDPAGALPNGLFVRVAERYVAEVMRAILRRVE